MICFECVFIEKVQQNLKKPNCVEEPSLNGMIAQNKTWTLKEMVEWMTKANENMFQHKFSKFCTFLMMCRLKVSTHDMMCRHMKKCRLRPVRSNVSNGTDDVSTHGSYVSTQGVNTWINTSPETFKPQNLQKLKEQLMCRHMDTRC